MTKQTKQMRAATYEEFSGTEKIKVTTTDVPELKEGEVLVRIKAAGVNPVDAAVMQGYLKDFLPYTFPVIPGWDMAGVIEDRGFSARRFKVGEEVYAYARRPMVQHGTFAEYVVVPESYLAKRPENISWEEASGIPLVGLTAYQSLYDAGQLQEGQTVLILGGSGGVGSLGIQLAKEKGATVIGVASQKNHSFMKELGADHTIDYKDTDVGAAVKEVSPEGVDLLFDCVSGDTLQQSLKALKSGGKLVSILNHGEDLDKHIDFSYVFVEPNSSQLDHLRELADAGKLKVRVSETYNLDETAEALQQIQTLHTTGKIVIVS
ncbi:NADPH:quinone reductase-like Zn-dependent oxidoreductase [Pontibacter ummariensis]|uniref:NADPH:quinone reductase n=2 Tax=Pontibacter ummariensis TaxID=1610492 RepID=A0A239IC49_9BACT|nr:NADPH:quinone reductase-like Zn-dependent oxidoreductase [Pontibacter ummariensis]SNS90643.1 NADPH:quinone reductase [Pontibacter ummariensis]